MKFRFLMTTAATVLLSSTFVTGAVAGNRGVESALSNYGDVSMFYQALHNTGVLAELDEHTHYTIFAPTNQAFAEIRADRYPCFYAVQCRAQVADVLRDHIAVGSRTLTELAKLPHARTIGRDRVFVESPYVGEYTADGNKVLSAAEIRGNSIYRIDGVIARRAELAKFSTMPSVVQESTTTTYQTPVTYVTPGGTVVPTVSETVVQKTYVAPTQMPDGSVSETTVTRTITTQP